MKQLWYLLVDFLGFHKNNHADYLDTSEQPQVHDLGHASKCLWELDKEA